MGITSATVLVLTNAIYFNASWHFPSRRRHHGRLVTKLDGSSSPTRLMHQVKEHRYAEGEGCSARAPLRRRERVDARPPAASGTFETFAASSMRRGSRRS